jgi:hypothetical protein
MDEEYSEDSSEDSEDDITKKLDEAGSKKDTKKSNSKSLSQLDEPVAMAELTTINRPMDKLMLEEMLLVVQNLGTYDVAGEFIRGEDCVQWLGDLQKSLSRDENDLRHVANILGTWQVLPKKLIPLMKSCKDDDALIRTMLKIFFMLTKVVKNRRYIFYFEEMLETHNQSLHSP